MEFVFEAFGEVGGAGETDGEGDFGYVAEVLFEQLGGAFEAVGLDELVGGFAGEGFDFFEEGGAAHAEFFGEFVGAEVLVGEVVFDGLLEFFEEGLVGGGDGDFGGEECFLPLDF